MYNLIHKIKKSVLSKPYFWVIINTVLLLPVSARAACGAGDGGGLTNPICADTFGQLISNIAQAAASVGVPIAAIAIIYSGFLFVTAMGNPEKLKIARSTFMWAVIGTAVLLGAWVIAESISGTVSSL